jgi:hypothetical protein
MLIFSLFFLIGGFGTAGSADLLDGLKVIATSPAQLTCDYFALAGMGATYLNAGLVGLACIAVLLLSGFQMNHLSLMAFFLTTGFSFFGMNILNIWPFILGTFLYSRVDGTPFKNHVNIALFATSLSPFVSEGMFRHPAFTELPGKIAFGIALGVIGGFLLPILCKHAPSLHKGYSLYNAAAVSGFIGILLLSFMYRATGFEIPSNTLIGESYFSIVPTFSAIMCLTLVVYGYFINGKHFTGFDKLLFETGYQCDYVGKYGVGLTAANIGLVGLCATLYYVLIGAGMTGPTMGCIICLMAVAPCGAHIINVIPIMLGYMLSSTFAAFELTTPATIVGICFAAAMAPIPGRFGLPCGIIAGLLHACMVTTVVTFHQGFCLYNGGFTCAVTCIILVPVLENFFVPHDHLRLLPTLKKKDPIT